MPVLLQLVAQVWHPLASSTISGAAQCIVWWPSRHYADSFLVALQGHKGWRYGYFDEAKAPGVIQPLEYLPADNGEVCAHCAACRAAALPWLLCRPAETPVSLSCIPRQAAASDLSPLHRCTTPLRP